MNNNFLMIMASGQVYEVVTPWEGVKDCVKVQYENQYSQDMMIEIRDSETHQNRWLIVKKQYIESFLF